MPTKPTVTREPSAAASDQPASPYERLEAERTERRRQRAVAHAAPRPSRGRRSATRGGRRTVSPSAFGQRARLTLRDAVSVSLIVVLVAGSVFGAILGSLSAASWLTGLLVASMTVLLSAVLRTFSRRA